MESALGGHPLKTLATMLRYGWSVAWTTVGPGRRENNPDRVTLEQVILPGYAAQPDVGRVLFVGCEAYTRDYARHFARSVTYWTLEPDPAKARFGAEGHHHVAGLETITDCFAPASLDLIVCNGVFGWGLDRRADCEAAFAGCHETLRDGGRLLVGWNDLPGRRPIPLESLHALSRFERDRFAPLGGVSRHLANPANRHVYDFFVKPGGRPDRPTAG